MKNKQLKYDTAYLKMADEWSKLSYCKRRQVGALIVKDKMIISDGYNGTPSGLKIFVRMKMVIQNGMSFMLKQMQLLKFLAPHNLLKELLCTLHFHHVENVASLFFNREYQELFILKNTKINQVLISSKVGNKC